MSLEAKRSACVIVLLSAAVAVAASAPADEAATADLSAMGFQCAVDVNIDASLKMEPVRKVLARKFGAVWPAGDGAFVPHAGARGEAAWVFPDGRIVAAGRHALSDRKTLAEVELAWKRVARVVSGVVAAVKEDACYYRYRAAGEFYTPQADEFQFLYVTLPRSFEGWVLNWPDARQTWAAVALYHVSWNATLHLDEKAILAGSRSEPSAVELGRVRFGEHAMKGDGDFRTWMVLTAFFGHPNGKVTLYDKSNRSVVAHAAYSRAMTVLKLPAPQRPSSPAPKPAVTPAALGYQAAVRVDLDASLKMAPVRQALEKKFGTVHAAGEGLFVPQAGARGEAAWVMPEGHLIVAARAPLTGDKAFSQLELAWHGVAQEVASVVADVTEKAIEERYFRGAEFFTAGRGQFQYLYVLVPRSFDQGWVLNWPDARQTWARLAEAPVSWTAALHLDEKLLVQGNRKEPVSADLTRVPFGEHALVGTGDHRTWLAIGAYFEKPNGELLLYNKANTSMVTHAASSWPLDTLDVPPCGAYPKR